MKLRSICGCIVFDSNPTPHPYTHPMRTMKIEKTLSWDIDIQKHETACATAQSIKDDILVHQSLDGPYPSPTDVCD